MSKVSVVVLNWNGRDYVIDAIESLRQQTLPAEIVVVDNASTDGSTDLIKDRFPDVTLLINRKNLGFAGGVNTGLRYAMEQSHDFVALLNNDAKADSEWLKRLVKHLESRTKTGIATGKFLDFGGRRIDSTGDIYTVWGLPYPRGRGEPASDKYDTQTEIFGASGGASLYRTRMLREIGLFDEDFFAYYEDVDISFRAQLAGWKIDYVPAAIAYHRIGATSSQLKGFMAYQTLKNLPWLFWKNVPWVLMPKIGPRLALVWLTISFGALRRGELGSFFKACIVGLSLLPKKLVQRHNIQKNRKVSVEYVRSIIEHDLPPNAGKLRSLRSLAQLRNNR